MGGRNPPDTGSKRLEKPVYSFDQCAGAPPFAFRRVGFHDLFHLGVFLLCTNDACHPLIGKSASECGTRQPRRRASTPTLSPRTRKGRGPPDRSVRTTRPCYETRLVECLGRPQEPHLSPTPNRHWHWGHRIHITRSTTVKQYVATENAHTKEIAIRAERVTLVESGKRRRPIKILKAKGPIANQYQFAFKDVFLLFRRL
jgi:hypothetical protein